MYVKMCAVFVYQLYFKKSEEKEKKEREGEREREKEGRNKTGGRKGKRKNVRRKGRRQLFGRGVGFLLSGLMMRAAFLIQSPSGVLIFIYLYAAFVPCFFPLKESISVTQKGRKLEIHCFFLVRKIKLLSQLVSGAQDNWEFSPVTSFLIVLKKKGFPGGSLIENSSANAGDVGSISGLQDPWRRKWQPIPVFLPGKSQGQRRLAGYSHWGHNELDMSEQLSMAWHKTAKWQL